MSPTDEELAHAMADYFGALEPGRCTESTRLALYAAEALTPAERQEFEGHVRSCDECRTDLARFAELERLRDESTGIGDADEAAPSRPRNPGDSPRLTPASAVRRRWQSRRALAVAMALAAALIVIVSGPAILSVIRERGLHAKGAWQLFVVAEHGGRVHQVAEDERLDAGDRLGFFYSADKPGHLLILYADQGGGLVSLFPVEAAAEPLRSAPITAGERVPIADGAVLTPGTGCEWVIAFHSNEPFSGRLARDAASKLVRERRDCRLTPPADEELDVQVLAIRRD